MCRVHLWRHSPLRVTSTALSQPQIRTTCPGLPWASFRPITGWSLPWPPVLWVQDTEPEVKGPPSCSRIISGQRTTLRWADEQRRTQSRSHLFGHCSELTKERLALRLSRGVMSRVQPIPRPWSLPTLPPAGGRGQGRSRVLLACPKTPYIRSSEVW